MLIALVVYVATDNAHYGLPRVQCSTVFSMCTILAHASAELLYFKWTDTAGDVHWVVHVLTACGALLSVLVRLPGVLITSTDAKLLQ